MLRLRCADTAGILRQKQLLRCWRRQRKIFSVEYLSTLPAKIFLFLASTEVSYFLGFFRHQHPSVAPLQTDLRNISQPHCMTEPKEKGRPRRSGPRSGRPAPSGSRTGGVTRCGTGKAPRAQDFRQGRGRRRYRCHWPPGRGAPPRGRRAHPACSGPRGAPP